jgi:AcrR family transcriptional regulator
MLPNQSKLDPRARRTRQLLQGAFVALLAEKSFHAITVQDIAERATVNRATFYAHFEDKQELLDSCVSETFRQQVADALPADAALNAENLQRLIVIACAFLAELNGHCAPTQRQFEDVIKTQVQAQLYEILLTWLNEATPRGRGVPTAELAAVVASWAIYGVAQHWSQGEQKLPAKDLARQVLPLIGPSLLNAQERA